MQPITSTGTRGRRQNEVSGSQRPVGNTPSIRNVTPSVTSGASEQRESQQSNLLSVWEQTPTTNDPALPGGVVRKNSWSPNTLPSSDKPSFSSTKSKSKRPSGQLTSSYQSAFSWASRGDNEPQEEEEKNLKQTKVLSSHSPARNRIPLQNENYSPSKSTSALNSFDTASKNNPLSKASVPGDDSQKENNTDKGLTNHQHESSEDHRKINNIAAPAKPLINEPFTQEMPPSTAVSGAVSQTSILTPSSTQANDKSQQHMLRMERETATHTSSGATQVPPSQGPQTSSSQPGEKEQSTSNSTVSPGVSPRLYRGADISDNHREGDEEIFNGRDDTDHVATPWWRQKRTGIILLILMIVIVIIAIAVPVGLSLSSNGSESKNTIASLSGTSKPSDNLRVTIPPTMAPTLSPSLNPTTCVSKLHSDSHELGLTSFNLAYPKVAVDGDHAVMASDSGYVLFYFFESGEWNMTHTFVHEEFQSRVAVAISGSVAIIGSPYVTTEDGENTGVAYIYKRNEISNLWERADKPLVPNDGGVAGATFGWSVSIDGDIIAVGAPEQNNKKGSVFVFLLDNDEWSQVDQILPSGLCEDESLGYAVSVNNGLIASSVDCDINIQTFRYNPALNSLEELQRIRYVSHEWGAISSMSLSGNNLVYSTVFGGLFIYNREDSEQSFIHRQVFNFSGHSDLYDYQLDIDGDILVAGIHSQTHIFSENNGEWEQSFSLENAGVYELYSGPSVAISGRYLLTGSSNEVTFFKLNDCIQPSPTGSPASFVPESPATDDEQILSSIPSKSPSSSPSQLSSLSSSLSPISSQFPPSTESPSSKSPQFPPSTDSPSSVSPQFPPPSTNLAPTFLPSSDKSLPPSLSLSQLPSLSPTFVPSLAPSIGLPDDCNLVQISLSFDQYPDDTSWVIAKVEDTRKETIEISPVYNKSLALTTESYQFCLPYGDFEFTIADVYGDGICCDWGDGSYTLAIHGEPITQGGEFKLSETTSFSFCYDFEIKLRFDRHPDDVSWRIVRVDGNGGPQTIEESPAYEKTLAFFTETHKLCLPEGSYQFTIVDNYGDGICCEWGDGQYVVSYNGEIIAEGGSFGRSEIISFSLPNDA